MTGSVTRFANPWLKNLLPCQYPAASASLGRFSMSAKIFSEAMTSVSSGIPESTASIDRWCSGVCINLGLHVGLMIAFQDLLKGESRMGTVRL